MHQPFRDSTKILCPEMNFSFSKIYPNIHTKTRAVNKSKKKKFRPRILQETNTRSRVSSQWLREESPRTMDHWKKEKRAEHTGRVK